MLFSEKLDLKLIKFVKENPVLYDYNNVKYMDFNAREVAWQKIGDELKRPAVDCKVRWINIRDVYRRILRKSICNQEQRTKKYKYENELAFMRPFYKDVFVQNGDFESDTKSNDHGNDDGYDDAPNSDDDEDEKPIRKLKIKRSCKTSSKKKKKRSYEEEEKPTDIPYNESTLSSDFDPTDPVDAFLMSIGSTLKTFSPYHLNLAKSKIFAVVQEHDLQQIMQKQRPEGSSHEDITTNSVFMQ